MGQGQRAQEKTDSGLDERHWNEAWAQEIMARFEKVQ